MKGKFYEIPKGRFKHIKHTRPKFKTQLIPVLIYFSEAIVSLGMLLKTEFDKRLTEKIYNYPGNETKELKTIKNWRTEITTMFGFIEHNGDYVAPSKRAKELCEEKDIVKALRKFLLTFQYPGNHTNVNTISDYIKNGIKFKPAQYILKLLKYASNVESERVGLTREEVSYMIFNDLSVTRDQVDVSVTWNRIKYNRENYISYKRQSDLTRYADDILYFMELAKLLICENQYYYLNVFENEIIDIFINSDLWFNEYEDMYTSGCPDNKIIRACSEKWIDYVNQNFSNIDFSIRSIYPEINTQFSDALIKRVLDLQYSDLRNSEIGSLGESTVIFYENLKLKKNNWNDQLHLIKYIPSNYSLGFDIQSIGDDHFKIFIEVKTTFSSNESDINHCLLTKNEWNTAESLGDRYYIYRVFIKDNTVRIKLLCNPVKLYKTDQIRMIPSKGAEIFFDDKVIKETVIITEDNKFEIIPNTYEKA